MDIQMAKIFKALSEPTRLKMLAYISRKKEVACADCSPYFSYLSQPTLSHHYKTLQEAGLLSIRKEGTGVCYKVNKDILKQVGVDIKMIKAIL
jgi:ArsR family transcriptional regulator, arsenate/arsenite/antimonite-responsive transcriptional repressor